MAREIHILPSADMATPRQVRLITVGMVMWIAIWVALSVWVAIEVAHLESLSDEALSLSHPLGQIAHVLAGLSSISFVGPAMRSASASLEAAAGSLRGSGVASRAGLQQLSLLLGLSIGLIPVVPFFVLFARLRQARRREASALQRALSDPARRAVAVRYLAGRGMTNLPYRELVEYARSTSASASGGANGANGTSGGANGTSGSANGASSTPGSTNAAGGDHNPQAEVLERIAQAELDRLGLGDERIIRDEQVRPLRRRSTGSRSRTG